MFRKESARLEARAYLEQAGVRSTSTGRRVRGRRPFSTRAFERALPVLVAELQSREQKQIVSIRNRSMRGIRRSLGTARAKKTPATVERIVAMALMPGTRLADIRDRALLLFGFAPCVAPSSPPWTSRTSRRPRTG